MHNLVSRVTNAVIKRVSRPLDAIYLIMYLDCIMVKIRQDKQAINKSIYLSLGINLEGHKELLGFWLTETEGAKFWPNVQAELQNRGVRDILICCVDGLKGFPDAINTVLPTSANSAQHCAHVAKFGEIRGMEGLYTGERRFKTH